MCGAGELWVEGGDRSRGTSSLWTTHPLDALLRCRRAALLGALFGALTVLGISLPHTSLWGRRAMSRHTRPDFPNSAATLELEQLLSSISIDGAVLATVASNASIWADEADPRSGLLPLWLDSAQRAAISNMFVAAYDEDTLHWLRARNVPAILRTATNCSRAASWVGCAKVDLLRDVATLAFNLLLTDSDILWLKNPFPFLAAPYDLLATSEGFGADAKDPSPGPYGDMQHARVDGWPPIHYHRVPHVRQAWFGWSRLGDATDLTGPAPAPLSLPPPFFR